MTRRQRTQARPPAGEGDAREDRGNPQRREEPNPRPRDIDVFVCKLRKKLATATSGENYIETVWGRGYVLRDPQGTETAVTETVRVAVKA